MDAQSSPTQTLEAVSVPEPPETPTRRAPRQQSRTALAVKVGALVFALVAGVGWFIVTREVTVRIDGESKTVYTRAANVAGLIEDMGHHLNKHDDICPAPSTTLKRGATVELNRARRVQYTLDGEVKYVWVTSRTVNGVLDDVNAPGGAVRISADGDDSVPLEGAELTVSTKKEITLVIAKEPKKLTTFAGTVEELVKEEKVSMKRDDRTVPELDAGLKDGDTVTVQRIVKRREVEEVVTPAPVETTESDEVYKDQTKVESPGVDGKVEETVDYIEADGEVIERKVVKTKVITEPEPRKVIKGTKPYPAPEDLNWAALAQCESGGIPTRVSSNGMYHGLYQFNTGTWQSVGGSGLPSEASSEEQTYRASLLYQRSGIQPWPHCGPKLLS